MRRTLVALLMAAMLALTGCRSPEHALVGATWTGPSGDAVLANTINVIRGPSHCDWQSSVWMHITLPADDPADTRQYIRDPRDAVPVELLASLDTDVDLPDGASYTGYQAEGVELRLGPDGGGDAIYVVFHADHVERWPRSAEVIVCA